MIDRVSYSSSTLRRTLGLLAFLLLPMSQLFATENPPNLVISGFSWEYFARLALTLTAVLVMFFLCAWVLRRSNLPSRAQNQSLSIVASISLGTRERLVVVQAGEKQVLLGITPTQINSLTELESPLALPDSKDENTFRSTFERLMSKTSLKT